MATNKSINRVPEGWRKSGNAFHFQDISVNVPEDQSNKMVSVATPDLFVNPKPSVPVNSAYGRIQEILMTPAADYFDGAPYWQKMYDQFFYNLIDALGGERRYVTLYTKGKKEGVLNHFDRAGIPRKDLFACHTVFDVSVWTQDPFLATTAEDGSTFLCTDVLYAIGKDQTIAPDVAMQVDWVDFNYSYLFFIGGNSLVSHDYLLLGKDFIYTNLGRKYLETVPAILHAFEQGFSMQPINVGTKNPIPNVPPGSSEGDTVFDHGMYQPIFHLDMFLTITGDRDPASGKEIILIGRPALAQKILQDTSKIYGHDQYFAEIEAQLSEYFVVKQLPIYPTTSVQTYPGNTGNLSYYLTYNNVVLENYFDQDLGRQVRTVYLTQYYDPSYPFNPRGGQEVRKKLDEAAVGIWEDLGFEVKLIPNMEIFASGNGSIHCMTKTLKRAPKFTRR
ncbi:MAG: hypothetical protein KTR24_12705 [Saprospiraceae bacterium]|nr:hypothetical protein [Saprospiraceae bacterium]